MPDLTPPPSTERTDGWLEWVNANLPYDHEVARRRASMSQRERIAEQGTERELEVCRAFPNDSRESAAEAARCWFIAFGVRYLEAVKRAQEQAERIRRERSEYVTRALGGEFGDHAKCKAEALLTGRQWTDARLEQAVIEIGKARNT